MWQVAENVTKQGKLVDPKKTEEAYRKTLLDSYLTTFIYCLLKALQGQQNSNSEVEHV